MMVIRIMMTREMVLQPRFMNHGVGGIVLESSSEVISSLSYFGFQGNGSCRSGEVVSDRSSPPVARGGKVASSAQSRVVVGTAGRGTSLIPDLVIMNSLSSATKSEVIIVPKYQQNYTRYSHFIYFTPTPTGISPDCRDATLSFLALDSKRETNVYTIVPPPLSH